MPNPLRQSRPMGTPQGMAGNQIGTTTNPMNAMQKMIFNKMYQSNPKFRQFADSMMGKTPEQAFRENGLDYNQYRNVDPNQIRNSFGI